MAEFISERFLNQLNQYLEQKPAREPSRGHRVRHLRGGLVNRLRPLAKRSGSGAFCRDRWQVNTPRFVATAAALYIAATDDWHISADCRANGVVVTLPTAVSVGAGKQIAIKESFGAAPFPFTVTVNATPGDTIDIPAVGVVFAAPRQSLVVISDGGTNWEVVV